MNATLKITKIGNSAGVILSKELLAHLNAQVGDKVEVVRTSRGLEIRPVNLDLEKQLGAAKEVMARRHRALQALADQIMDEDREILKALAKS
ncbi:AbrB/MazE/SpoVT family DNA-binding domain-containing protein [Novosphingobium aquae]|jgi:putative addiction module antidote|uniref:AbrB/MazE/SpoVT family DNA-binding domain-containing protein n=1 Tax=Novosphingobium aquae TaxID=3133435 RepID=A0ABU8SDG6_9SPHN